MYQFLWIFTVISLVVGSNVSTHESHRRLNGRDLFVECNSEHRDLIDAVYVVHSKDIGTLEWGLRSMHCHCGDIGRAWIISDNSNAVHSLIKQMNREFGEDWVKWIDETSFPFTIADVRSKHPQCGAKCGWYLQQFLKMYAGRVVPGIRDFVVVDADVVWFKDFTLVDQTDSNGKPTTFLYNTAAQNVRPYFAQIAKLTDDRVTRVDPRHSGVTHHMVFKLDVLEDLLQMVEKSHGTSFWKASLQTVDPKAYSGFSEYELYFNYALQFHPTTIKLRHLTFANGPSPTLMYVHGDESNMGAPVWIHGNFEKQMTLDHKIGFHYVGYHSYAKRRYYDAAVDALEPYCTELRVQDRNSKMERACSRYP